MPALLRAWTTIAFQPRGFRSARILWRFARIEADREHVEILADIKFHRLQSAGQAAQDLAAQHRAFVINQVQDDRMLAEVIAQANRLSRLIAEREVPRNLFIQVLLDADMFQTGRAYVRGWRFDAGTHALRPHRRGRAQDQSRDL